MAGADRELESEPGGLEPVPLLRGGVLLQVLTVRLRHEGMYVVRPSQPTEQSEDENTVA